ncbi:MAG: cation diffusion facilitator family transporter [Rhizobiales bacterium]|nr:cation diffusion facilitator family transporter [Hyphomicrobiales bacterium]
MHGGHAHGLEPSMGQRHAKRLAMALGLTCAITVVEVIGGLWAGSLALIADAAHMLTDAGGLALALFAIRFAARPATPRKTYGYLRAEILSALLNAVVLLLLSGYILYEAYQRVLSPPEIRTGVMLAVAVIGLAANFASMRLLASGADESLNVKGAYFEVFSDMLGSLGVIIAALIVMLTGWTLADPIVAAGIGLFIVPRTWNLLKQATHILLEGTPAAVDLELLKSRLMSIDGVVAVHDLHVWTITSGFDCMTGHVVVRDMGQCRRILSEARERMMHEFKLAHVTIQIEDQDFWESEKNLHA